MGVLLDTSVLIDVLEETEDTVLLADRLDERREPVLMAAPALYEIETGIRFTGSRSEAKRFERSTGRFPIAPFDEEAAREAALVRAELLRLGEVKSHPGVMIAGIALARGHRLVTGDEDFAEIADAVGLAVERYDAG